MRTTEPTTTPAAAGAPEVNVRVVAAAADEAVDVRIAVLKAVESQLESAVIFVYRSLNRF